MTLFGTTLDGPQMMGLVGLLATLALWLIVYFRDRDAGRWFRRWEADRKARREAELGLTSTEADRPKTGPWG